jgi:hypothetical protein
MNANQTLARPLSRSFLTRLRGHGQGLLNTSAEGWTVQIIPGEPEAGISALEQGQVGQTLAMADIELRNGARPSLDIGKGWLLLRNTENGSEFAMDGGDEFRCGERRCLGIGHAADETGEEDMIFWGAAREER